MRTLTLRFAGVLCLVGLLALQAAARAAPQLTITPRHGADGALFVLTGVGFAPSTTYHLRLAAQDGARAIVLADPAMAFAESASDGVLLAAFRVGGAVPAGAYVAQVATAPAGGEIVAAAPFALSGAGGAAAGPQLALTPAQSREGELVLLTGAGFAPGGAYALRVRAGDRQAPIALEHPDLRADADGVILAGVRLAGPPGAGAYSVEVLTAGAAPTVVASAPFTVLPDLPPTGGGGMRGPTGGAGALLLGGGLVVGMVLAAHAAVRRRAR